MESKEERNGKERKHVPTKVQDNREVKLQKERKGDN